MSPGLEKAYEDKKKEMTRRLGSAGVNECLLFHGTSFANSEAILRENFRLDKVGAEGRRACPHTSSLPLLHPTGRSATCAHVSSKHHGGAGRKPGAYAYVTQKRLSYSLMGASAKAWCLLYKRQRLYLTLYPRGPGESLVPPYTRGSVYAFLSEHLAGAPGPI